MAATAPMTAGIVLLAHGSRDPQWREPIEAVARQITAQSPELLVRCAYLELAEPDLQAAVAELVAAGAGSLRVLPMFVGLGRHVREDLPRLVAQAQADHPRVAITLQPAVGQHPWLIDALARIALQNETKLTDRSTT